MTEEEITKLLAPNDAWHTRNLAYLEQMLEFVQQKNYLATHKAWYDFAGVEIDRLRDKRETMEKHGIERATPRASQAREKELIHQIIETLKSQGVETPALATVQGG